MTSPSDATQHLNATIRSSKSVVKKAQEELAKEPQDLDELAQRLSGLQSKEIRLKEAYEKRENEIAASQVENKEDLYFQLMDSQDENLDNLQRAIRALEKIVVTVKSEAPVAVTEVRHKINAPAIKLLTFDGTTAEFAPFWDNFESQIGKRTDLSAVDKLAYLKGQLKGAA